MARKKPGPHPEKPLDTQIKTRADKETMEKSIGTVEKIFNEYKANATRQIKFRGFQPGASSDKPPKITEDQQIRAAMRLRT